MFSLTNCRWHIDFLTSVRIFKRSDLPCFPMLDAVVSELQLVPVTADSQDSAALQVFFASPQNPKLQSLQLSRQSFDICWIKPRQL